MINLVRSKNYMFLLPIIFIAFALFACSNHDKAENKIKIGALLPLTGENASYGVDCRKGMELAAEEYNATSKKKATIIFEDTQADPKTAVTAINKLISTDHPKIILGDMFSNTTMAIAPIAQANGIVLITPTASLETIVQVGDHIFSIYPSDRYEGEYVAQRVLHDNMRKIAVYQQQLQVFDTMSDSFRKRIESAGARISYYEVFPSNTTDFRSIIEKHKKDAVDSVFIAAYKKEAFDLIKQIRELDPSTRIYSQSTLYDPETISSLGKAAEGIIFSAPFFNEQSDATVIKTFRNNYSKKFGSQPNIWAAYGYDVVMLALQANLNAVKARIPLQQAVQKIQFDGVTGPMTFNPNRTAKKVMEIFEVKNGMFVKY